MPAPMIKSFAKKSDKSKDEVEKLYKKAKEIASEQYPDIEKGSEQYYQIVTGILKNMTGFDECIVLSKDKVIEGTIVKKGTLFFYF